MPQSDLCTFLFLFIVSFVYLIIFYVAAFFIAFIGSSCDTSQDSCVFQHPAEAILGTFTMSVGDFEDFTGIFATARYPALVSVSYKQGTQLDYSKFVPRSM